MVYPPREGMPKIPVSEPYVPEQGTDELPALRYVIFADSSHQIQHIDESANTVQGYWESPSLVRPELSQLAAVWGVTALLLYYSSKEDRTIGIQWTPNGGSDWREERSWTLLATGGGIRSKLKGFNVTGSDLRFRLIFREAQPLSIHAYRPRLIPRGTLIKAGR